MLLSSKCNSERAYEGCKLFLFFKLEDCYFEKDQNMVIEPGIR